MVFFILLMFCNALSLFFSIVAFIFSVVAFIFSIVFYNKREKQTRNKQVQEETVENKGMLLLLIEWLLSIKKLITYLGIALITFPLIYVTFKGNPDLISSFPIEYLIPAGVGILFFGLSLFGIEKPTDKERGIFIIKVIVYFAAIIFLVIINDIETIWALIWGIIISVIVLDDLVKIIYKIYKKFTEIKEEKLKVSIVLAIVAAIISLVFKIDIKF